VDWVFLAVVVVIAFAYVFLRRSGQISADDAQAFLKSGALVVDVRTPAEFSARHLPGAINIPLDQIESTFPLRVSDKNQPILLHCQAGTRSAVAKRKLISLGYANARNLGSYSRAARIIDLAKL
jgi:phage shock protein E